MNDFLSLDKAVEALRDLSACSRKEATLIATPDNSQVLIVDYYYDLSIRCGKDTSVYPHQIHKCACPHSPKSSVSLLAQMYEPGALTKHNIMYTTFFPCLECAKAIIECGLIGVISVGYTSSRDKANIEKEVRMLIKESKITVLHKADYYNLDY